MFFLLTEGELVLDADALLTVELLLEEELRDSLSPALSLPESTKFKRLVGIPDEVVGIEVDDDVEAPATGLFLKLL